LRGEGPLDDRLDGESRGGLCWSLGVDGTAGGGPVNDAQMMRDGASRAAAPRYPWLTSLYPVVALLGQNIDQVRIVAGLRPLALSVLSMALALLVARVLLRDGDKAAALASLGFVLFFSYGHVYALVEKVTVAGVALGDHRILLTLWALLLAVGTWRIARARQARRWVPALNAAAGIALAIPLVQIGAHQIRLGPPGAQARTPTGVDCALSLPTEEPAPDLYYIILDGYMRSDVLSETTGYDNTPFLEALEEMGFVVARESRSNYPWTDMSLSSSLNLSYLPEMGWPVPDQDWTLARSLIGHSLLRRDLECLGYSTIAFETGYPFSEWRDADYFLMPGGQFRDRLGLAAGITQFEWMWINTSVGRALEGAELARLRWPPGAPQDPGQNKRERVLFDLEELPAIAAAPGPKLVFVHIISPHFPFVFGPNGEHVFLSGEAGPPSARHPEEAERYWNAYADEVAFLDGRVLEAIRGILARSSTPPIIVLQGDHGYVVAPREAKPPILNAYYLPGGEAEQIYDGITPVNTFRIILNAYFGADFELLEDVSYCTLPNSNDIDLEPCLPPEPPAAAE
jgi:hypothetical protein